MQRCTTFLVVGEWINSYLAEPLDDLFVSLASFPIVYARVQNSGFSCSSTETLELLAIEAGVAIFI